MEFREDFSASPNTFDRMLSLILKRIMHFKETILHMKRTYVRKQNEGRISVDALHLAELPLIGAVDRPGCKKERAINKEDRDK